MKRLICELSLVVCVFLIPSSVNAYVQNLTTGQLLFYDTFQEVTSVSHTAYADPSGDYDPVAMSSAPSTWAIYNEDALGQQVQVTDSTTSPDPGSAPDYGPNYLRVSRIAGLGGRVEAQFEPQDETGDHIKMACWLNVPDVWDGFELNIYLSGGGLANQLIVNYGGLDPLAVYNAGSIDHDTGLTFTPGVWQKWEFDYVVDDLTFTLTIDGESATELAMITPGGIGSFEYSQGGQNPESPNPFYLGEVTLPAIPKPGDANNDGFVDETDAAALSENWLAETVPGTWLAWTMGDFNDDGVVNDVDATLMASNWTGAPLAGVPEPGLIALLLSGLIGLLFVRNKS